MSDTSSPASPPPNRRRWFRLSLRGLMLLILMIGGGLGWKIDRVRTERQASAVIRAANGAVQYELAPNAVLKLTHPIGTPLAQAGPAWLRRWLGDDFFRPVVYAEVPDVPSPAVLEAIGRLGGLVALDVRCVAGLPDRAWEPLAGLTRLEVVNFQCSGVTNAALVAISGAGSIRTVSLSSDIVAVTDAGLATLAKLPALEALDLSSCPNLTDAGVGRMLASSPSRVLNKFNWSSHHAPVGATIRALGEHHRQLKDLDLDGGPTDDADLAPLGKLTNLVHLNLGEIPFRDASVVHLEPLVNLQSFSGNFAGVSDTGMQSVGKLQNLQGLTLNGSKFGDNGMKPIGNLPNLRSLFLIGSKFGDAGLVHLAGRTQLERLSLRNSLVTDVGLKFLGGLKNLVWLDLGGSKVGDTGLADLAGLPKLVALDLTNTRLTDAGAATLAQFPSLFMATLSETQVTDATLDGLKRPGRLRSLELQSTQVTPAGVARFQAARPFVRVTYSPPPTAR